MEFRQGSPTSRLNYFINFKYLSRLKIKQESPRFGVKDLVCKIPYGIIGFLKCVAIKYRISGNTEVFGICKFKPKSYMNQ